MMSSPSDRNRPQHAEPALRMFGSSRSPFSRKVRVAAAMLGVDAAIGWIDTVASQFDPVFDPALAAVNPLLQLPTLAIGADDAVADSSAIVAWLDLRFAPGRLIPTDAAARVACIVREALADNLIAKLVRRAEELRKPEAARSANWLTTNAATMARVFDRLDSSPPAGCADIGDITTAVALDYADFRCGSLAWREGRPRLAAWHAAVAATAAFTDHPFAD